MALIDPVGNRTRWEYDVLCRVTKEINPLGEERTFEYDDVGRMTLKTDRLGRVVEYAYDDADRLTQEVWKTGGTTVQTLSYTYADGGQVLTASAASGAGAGTYTFTYDDLGRRESQEDVYGKTLTFAYDDADRRTQVTDSESGVIDSSYDDVHRLTSRSQSGTGVAGLRVEYDYDAANRRTLAERFNAATSGTKIGRTVFDYDDASRLTSQVQQDGSSTPLVSYSYDYDNASRLIEETRNASSKTYDYDQNSQLVDDTDNTYSYDLNGNRTMAGYDVGANNRLASDGTWSYSYDEEGNLTKKSLGVSAETWTYGFDHRNQITWIEKRATDGGTLQKRIDYGYDVYGNQVDREVTVSGASHTKQAFEITNNSPGITHSVHDVWADLDSGGSLTNRYFLGDGQGEKLARSGSGTYWLLQEARLGSLREVTDSSGSVVNEIDYDGFGNITTETGPTYTGNFTYTGLRRDLDAGISWAHWRGYNTDIAQWVSEDPIGFSAGDANVRRYVGNSGTNGTDLNGMLFKSLSYLFSTGAVIETPDGNTKYQLSNAKLMTPPIKFEVDKIKVMVKAYHGSGSKIMMNWKNYGKDKITTDGSFSGGIHFVAEYDSEADFKWIQFCRRDPVWAPNALKKPFAGVRSEDGTPNLFYGKWSVDNKSRRYGVWFAGYKMPVIENGVISNSVYDRAIAMSDRPSFDPRDGEIGEVFSARTLLVYKNKIVYSFAWEIAWEMDLKTRRWKQPVYRLDPKFTGLGAIGFPQANDFNIDSKTWPWFDVKGGVPNPLK